MIKKIGLFLLALIILFQTVFVSAQTKTATPTSDLINKEEVQKLKDKVATKVAQLRKEKQDLTTGIITEIKENVVMIKNHEDEKFQVKIDEALTKYYQINENIKKEINLDDFKKDDYIIVTGPMTDTSINANAIYKDTPYQLQSGIITEKNKQKYYLQITTFNKDKYIIDIERTTKQSMVDTKTLKITKTGFSKIKEGDTVHFVFKNESVKKETGENNRFTAKEILIIPQEYFEQ